MMNAATPPSKVPMKPEPIASAREEPVYAEILMHEAAMPTPKTAARSSNRTTFTLGSTPLITEDHIKVKVSKK